jgi:hypothetical protein
VRRHDDSDPGGVEKLAALEVDQNVGIPVGSMVKSLSKQICDGKVKLTLDLDLTTSRLKALLSELECPHCGSVARISPSSGQARTER